MMCREVGRLKNQDWCYVVDGLCQEKAFWSFHCDCTLYCSGQRIFVLWFGHSILKKIQRLKGFTNFGTPRQVPKYCNII